MVNRILADSIAGLMAAAVIVCITGCGQRSARFMSDPPESTPGWKDYTATATEYETSAVSDGDVAEDDVRALGAASPTYTEYNEDDFTSLKPGWYEREEGWYYFDGELRMLTGWIEVDGSYYCMDEHGLMYADTVRDGWYLDKDGCCQDEIPDTYTEPSGEDALAEESESAAEGDGARSTAAAVSESGTTAAQSQTKAAQPRTKAAQRQTAATQRQTSAAQQTTAATRAAVQSAADTAQTEPQSTTASGKNASSSQNDEGSGNTAQSALASDSTEQNTAASGGSKDSQKEADSTAEGSSAESKSSSTKPTETHSSVIIATRAAEAEEETETEKASYAVSDGHEAGMRPH